MNGEHLENVWNYYERFGVPVSESEILGLGTQLRRRKDTQSHSVRGKARRPLERAKEHSDYGRVY